MGVNIEDIKLGDTVVIRAKVLGKSGFRSGYIALEEPRFKEWSVPIGLVTEHISALREIKPGDMVRWGDSTPSRVIAVHEDHAWVEYASVIPLKQLRHAD